MIIILITGLYCLFGPFSARFELRRGRTICASVVIFVSARLWWQKYKLQFEKEIHHQIETARAQNLTDEKIQEIILSDANLKKSSVLGEDEAYLLKMLSE